MRDRTWTPCLLCGRTSDCTHHLIHGSANRRLSDRYGLTVRLCGECHRRVHATRELDLRMMRHGQAMFEQTHTREEFRAVFGKSWMEDEE